jgi:hypothetical protein
MLLFSLRYKRDCPARKKREMGLAENVVEVFIKKVSHRDF